MSETVEIRVPDIGNSSADVIAVEVQAGDAIAVDDTLITLETDKAAMDVPATAAGTVKAVHVKVGDKVSEGVLIVELGSMAQTAAEAASSQSPQTPAADTVGQNTPAVVQAVEAASSQTIQEHSQTPIADVVGQSMPVAAFGITSVDEAAFAKAHAGPSARKLARELGVDLGSVKGTGMKGRIVGEDIKAFVKAAMHNMAGKAVPQTATVGTGLDLLPWPQIDFAKFGEIKTEELSRIKKISAKNLSRNWVVIPHVTVNDEADLTELETFRQALNKEWERENLKISPLAFIIKASAVALKVFPEFNASLEGENIILKNFYNIGFAADTPNGLVVPVIADVDKKGLKEITQELTALSKKAREGKLKVNEMQGATFTVSSLGGIGGTGFTPIINAPEVAILGVCKSQIKPIWNGKEFQPRLMCPLSLSFDHRVIDGAAAMRFTVYIAGLLKDFRRVVL